MIIKRVRGTQFAGLRDIDKSFTDGMNLCFGKNEAGKSTLIGLIYSLLFQNAALNMTSKTDKAFKSAYFPARRMNGEQGDYIDGIIDISSDNMEYCVSKKWGDKGRAFCRIDTPDGSIEDGAKASEILAERLGFGRGIYDEIVFSSQKNRDNLIQSLFGGDSDMRRSLSEVVSRAMLETGGVSVENLKNGLNERILQLSSKWNEADGRPENGRGIDNPWKKEVGQILEAYYTCKRLELDISDTEEREKLTEKLAKSKSELDRFLAVYPNLQKRKSLSENILSANAELEKLLNVQKKWPIAQKCLEHARKLKSSIEAAQARAILEKLNKLSAEIDTFEKSYIPVEQSDLRECRELERAASAAKNKLTGMNIAAKISLKDGVCGKIISQVDGRYAELKSGAFRIGEAVKISVPDVIELSLSPADVDVAAVQEAYNTSTKRLSWLLGKYGVKSVSELEELSIKSSNARSEIEVRKQKYSTLLDGRKVQDISIIANRSDTAQKPLEELTREVNELYKGKTLDAAIGSLEFGLDSYRAEYGDISSLEKLISEKNKRLAALYAEQEKADALPEEFAKINDPDAEYARLNSANESAARQVESLKSRTGSGLSSDELAEQLAAKQAEFSALREELRRWQHIRAVVEEVMNESDDAPIRAIEGAFCRNLAILSGGGVSGEMSENLTAEVYSKGSKMSAEILSEGTKSTVSLAFRLAVIDWLFPEGGGLCVLDDPFTDMDKERCERACRLVEDFAKRHQVLFFTCDEKYEKLLNAKAQLI